MNIEELELPGVKILIPKYFEDFRGYYTESYSSKTLAKMGINHVFIQDNHLWSMKRGTLRGIHFQNFPKAQTKLLRCTKGKILDVVVDLRKDSRTYKKWVSIELSSENRKQILIPKGFGHACLSLVDDTEVQYKVDEFYEPEFDRTIVWNDPELNINWGMNQVITSDKDKQGPQLKDSDVNFTMENCNQ